MTSKVTSQPARRASAIAERLRAHARLCEQVACECLNEAAAENLKRMAQDCVRAAAEIAQDRPERDTPSQTRH